MYLTLAFLAAGLQRGDKVAIVGGNRPEWLFAELAAQACGACSVGICHDSPANEVAYLIEHCDARMVVVEDREQVDEVLQQANGLHSLDLVIYCEPRGLKSYRHPKLRSFEEMLSLGRQEALMQDQRWERLVGVGSGDDIAIICYTSGATGKPKGAMLTYRNLLAMVENLHQVDPRYGSDEFVSFLPLAWVGEQMIAVACGLAEGFTVNFPEKPETVMADLREIAPHTVFAPSCVWEGIASMVQLKIMDAGPVTRRVYEMLMRVGARMTDMRSLRQKVPLSWRLRHVLADWILFRPIRDRLGLSNIRTCATGDAPLAPDIFRFFHAIGVPLKQLYGQTEISGLSCIHRDGDVRFDTVGRPLPGTSIRISEKGEILSKSASVFVGYYKDEEETRQALRGGWLYSGDAGYFTGDGHLVVVGRIGELIHMTDGTPFSPQHIENRLKLSPYIKEAVVLGKNRPYVGAMVCIDMATVGKWAEKQRLSYTTYVDLSAQSAVYDLIEREVRRVNSTLPAPMRIRKFVLLCKELNADDLELTRMRKVRRAFVEERYSDVVGALYSDALSVQVSVETGRQDGERSTITSVLQLRPVS